MKKESIKELSDIIIYLWPFWLLIIIIIGNLIKFSL